MGIQTIEAKYGTSGWAGHFEPHPYLIDGIPATEDEVAAKGLGRIVEARLTDESPQAPEIPSTVEITDHRLRDIPDPAALLG
jgi:hypothetical protein